LAEKLRDYGENNWHKSTIIFAPHQDDETLGCGGTIKKISELDKLICQLDV
jgi:LmbE family N-acetylglucosaminyl deacetylase